MSLSDGCDTLWVDNAATFTVTTSRGRRFYFWWDRKADGRIGNIAKKKALSGFCMDVRGDGGYVVCEGSQHASGHIYGGNDMPVAVCR